MPTMTLSAVRGYLQASGPVSVRDIAVHFDSSPDAVRPLLDQWMSKGRVRRLAGGDGSCGKSKAGGCTCTHAPAEVYAWNA